MNKDQLIAQAIDAALAAGAAAALAQFERDGGVDCGSCGGAMLGYRANTKFAKALLARGIGFKSDRVYVSANMRDGIPSQHAEIDIQALRAFRAKAEELGFAASRYWTYVD